MFQTSGENVFEDRAHFDELAVLQQNYDYLVSTLDLCGIDLRYADEADLRIQEECCPQEPFISFRTEPSVPLTCINNQPMVSCFEMAMPVYQDDSIKSFADRLAKETKNKGVFIIRTMK